jgi:hypothetical protein
MTLTQSWWCLPVIPALERLKQEKFKFEALIQQQQSKNNPTTIQGLESHNIAFKICSRM